MITGNEVTAISGIGGAIVGGGLTWISTWLSQQGQDKARRIEVRRDAYARLSGAFDHLQRVWEAPETLALPADLKMGAATGEAVGRIQDAYGIVLLVGSDDARAKARLAWSAAWDLTNLLNVPGEKRGKLGPTFDAFRDAALVFWKQAVAEVAP